MRTVKEVVYREEDEVIIIQANEGDPAIRFLGELPNEQQVIFNTLKSFCLSLLDNGETIKYIVCKTDTLYIQPVEGKEVEQVINELDATNKAKVVAVATICTNIINE